MRAKKPQIIHVSLMKSVAVMVDLWWWMLWPYSDEIQQQLTMNSRPIRHQNSAEGITSLQLWKGYHGSSSIFTVPCKQQNATTLQSPHVSVRLLTWLACWKLKVEPGSMFLLDNCCVFLFCFVMFFCKYKYKRIASIQMNRKAAVVLYLIWTQPHSLLSWCWFIIKSLTVFQWWEIAIVYLFAW